MTTVILVRHGDNDCVGNCLAGRLPGIHLNQVGQSQATQVGQFLAHLPIKAIYSSPLDRAVETAEPLASVKMLPITPRENLIEVDYGLWQGRTFEELQQMEEWRKIFLNPAEFHFPEGESLMDAQQRICEEIDILLTQHAEDETIICFSHGDLIRLAVANYLNMPFMDFHRLVINTASTTTLKFIANSAPRLLHVNQVAHLNQNHF